MRKLFGYSDEISLRPGGTIRFMVSSLDGAPYRADIVRLICGDDSPAGPGFKETVVETPAGGVCREHRSRLSRRTSDTRQRQQRSPRRHR